jgi:crossover junction endodeoxyribonuclease RuvC
MPCVLALDLASVTGWAVGEPGATPEHGSIRFASKGASHEAVFASAYDWMREKIDQYHPDLVVWESPMPTSFNRGSTNTNTTTLLYGLPAVIGMTAYKSGIFDIRKATTRDVRMHFIGQNPRGHVGKKLVIQQCRALGHAVTDDNQSDAIATWSYMCALIEPKLAMAPTPLFGRGVSR